MVLPIKNVFLGPGTTFLFFFAKYTILTKFNPTVTKKQICSQAESRPISEKGQVWINTEFSRVHEKNKTDIMVLDSRLDGPISYFIGLGNQVCAQNHNFMVLVFSWA